MLHCGNGNPLRVHSLQSEDRNFECPGRILSPQLSLGERKVHHLREAKAGTRAAGNEEKFESVPC